MGNKTHQCPCTRRATLPSCHRGLSKRRRLEARPHIRPAVARTIILKCMNYDRIIYVCSIRRDTCGHSDLRRSPMRRDHSYTHMVYTVYRRIDATVSEGLEKKRAKSLRALRDALNDLPVGPVCRVGEGYHNRPVYSNNMVAWHG